MYYTVKCFGIIYEASIKVPIVLPTFFKDVSHVEDMISGSLVGPEPGLDNIDFFIKFALYAFLEYFKKNLAGVADEGDGAVITAQLEITFFWEWYVYRAFPCYRP